MNIQAMKLFLQVVEWGSFQKVADQNFISQRAVSQQIKKLEEELGVLLFIRKHNHIQLTAAGEYFRQRCELMIDMMEDTVGRVKNYKAVATRQIKVGYFSPFDAALIRERLLALPSETAFTMVEEGIEHLTSDVIMENLDCAMIMDDYGFKRNFEELGLSTVTLFEDTMGFGIGKRLGIAPEVSLNDIKSLPVIYYSPENSNYLKEAFLASLNREMHTFDVQRVNSYEQMQMLVSLGEAVAFYPIKLAKRFSNPTEPIQYVIPKDYRSRRFTFKLCYRSKIKNPTLKQLVKLIIES